MRFLFFFFLINFFFYLNHNSLAENKVVFLDLNYLLKESSEGKKILDELEKINKSNMELLDKEAKLLKEDENKILGKKNILSQAEYDKEINIFKAKVDNFNKDKKKMLDSFENEKNYKMNLFFENLNIVLNKYMEENLINIIIDKKYIIMAKNKNDISKEILNLLNND